VSPPHAQTAADAVPPSAAENAAEPVSPARSSPVKPVPKPADTCSAAKDDRITDRFETYVFVTAVPDNFECASTTSCCIVPNTKILFELKRMISKQFHLRSVFFDKLNVPKPNTGYLITPVSVQGELIANMFNIIPATGATDEFGNSSFTVKTTSEFDTSIKIVRLRIDFKDRQMQSFSLSPYIRILP